MLRVAVLVILLVPVGPPFLLAAADPKGLFAQRFEPPSPQMRVARLTRSASAVLAEADARYAGRAEGRVGPHADSREISEAIAGYEAAAEDLNSAQARWKLARALYFSGSYTGLNPGASRAVFEKASRAGEEAIAIVARRARREGEDFVRLPVSRKASLVSRDPDAAPSFFWAAVAWGQWALAVGKVQAAKAGAAARIRDCAEIVIAIDPEFEEGGGYRILGRLHDQAPWIPFLTGWVSRQEALRNLRLAVRVNGRNFVNRHFLAEALAGGGTAERLEAVSIEERLAADSPSPGHLVEELSIQEEAKKNLAAWRK